MGRFCKNCGAPLGENDQFCTSCGTKVEAAASTEVGGPQEAPKQEAPKYEEAPKTEYKEARTVNTAGITERSIALAIILSIITCGIYGLYWMYRMNEDINQIAGDNNATNGGLVIVLSIVTCGIYGWYWNYKMGEKVDNMKGSDSNKLLFIILAIFGLGIVNLAIMQDAVNKEITK